MSLYIICIMRQSTYHLCLLSHESLGELSRFVARTGRADMRAKSSSLPFDIASLARVVEPCFADGDDPRMARQLDQLIGVGLIAGGLIGVHADRSVDIRIARRDVHYGLKIAQIHAHAECVSDARRRHPCEDLVEIAGELWEIQMAVRIDQQET